MAQVGQDERYTQLCGNSADWEWALAGDSHGRNILASVAGSIGYQRFEGGVRLAHDYNFAQGGRRVINFQGDPTFNMLRTCEAPIVALHLGGNDLDMRNNDRPWRSVVRDLLNLFVDLERGGKICYIVALPFRHSRRHQDLQEMQRKIKAINRKLKNVLGRRYIPLPSATYHISAFTRSRFNGHDEYVHLRPWAYRLAALQVLDRLNKDLQGQLLPPSEFMEKVNRTIELFE